MFNQTPKKITSLQHPLVKKWVKLRENSQWRISQNEILIVGKTLIKELSLKIEPFLLITTEQIISSKSPFIEVSYEVMKKISGVPSPESLAAIFPYPTFQKKAWKKVIASDGIADPGNLGTIMRTALAFGWEALFLLPKSVDPFNEKVIRSSRAAGFYLPILQGTWKEFHHFLKDCKLDLYAADLEGDYFEAISPPKRLCLLFGNESLGLSQEARTFAKKVTIPMHNEMESLNVAVAAGLLLYHFGDSHDIK